VLTLLHATTPVSENQRALNRISCSIRQISNAQGAQRQTNESCHRPRGPGTG
jgi:hypothetical protein